MKQEKLQPTAIDYSKIAHNMARFKDARIVDFYWDNGVAILVIEQKLPHQVCPSCQHKAFIKDRPVVELVDDLFHGQYCRLRWIKHRFVCKNPHCATTTWTSTDPRIGSSRCLLTTRAAKRATYDVGEKGLEY